jgi:Protein of unknown function (DUF3499)
VRQICSRPECADRAVARVVIDAQNCCIIVDKRIEEPGAALMCLRHADRVTVPKGWSLDDRRDDNPRLFGIGRFNEPKQPRERHRRTAEPVFTDPGTPYDYPEEYESAPDHPVKYPDRYGTPPMLSVTDRALARARERELAGTSTSAIYSDAEARGPLLARAFDAARSRVRPSSGLASLIPQGPTAGDETKGSTSTNVY